MMPSIADRILSILLDGPIELKALRIRLSDLPPGPVDYAIQGLCGSGRTSIVSGRFLQLSSSISRPVDLLTPAAVRERQRIAAQARAQSRRDRQAQTSSAEAPL